MTSSAVVTELALQPSYRALHFLLPLHAAPLAAIPLFYRGEAVWPPLLLAVVVGASWLYVRRHPALGFGRRALVRILAHEDGEWMLEDGDGEHHAARLASGTVVLSRFLVLNFKLRDGGRRTRLLLGDEAEEQPLHRLRAYLLGGAMRSARPHDRAT